MPAYLAGSRKTAGNTGNKPKTQHSCGLQPGRHWEQSGDKVGTEWEQTQSSLSLCPIRPRLVIPAWTLADACGKMARSGLPLAPSIASGHVHNSPASTCSNRAEKIGTVDKLCKCLKCLEIPVNVHKTIHIAYFRQRVLCQIMCNNKSKKHTNGKIHYHALHDKRVQP